MIGNDWDSVLKDEFEQDYYINLEKFVKEEYHSKVIYPKINEIYKAFKLTSYKDTKVVILGQDPYHGENQAEGLSFSVKIGVKKPPSLVNIFKELHSDLGIEAPVHGSLVSWASQGVLLLNAVLTVECDKAASHKDRGWEIFTDKVIQKINEKEAPVVFILWGSYARSKKKYITGKNKYVIESAHPSPLSAYNGFFGSRPFSQTNNYLADHGLKPIDWSIK